jgi:hypothetical protein
MKEEPAKWINFLIALVPLAQTCAWIVVAWFLLTRFGSDIARTVSSIATRVSRGDRIKVGPVELATERIAVDECIREVSELKAQIAADAPKQTLMASVQKLDAAITRVSTANTALAVGLHAVDLISPPPDLGKPPSATKPSQ